METVRFCFTNDNNGVIKSGQTWLVWNFSILPFLLHFCALSSCQAGAAGVCHAQTGGLRREWIGWVCFPTNICSVKLCAETQSTVGRSAHSGRQRQIKRDGWTRLPLPLFRRVWVINAEVWRGRLRAVCLWPRSPLLNYTCSGSSRDWGSPPPHQTTT